MNAKELVNRMAIRSTYVTYQNGRVDFSYTNEPIFFRVATDAYIIFTYPEGSILDADKLHILGYDFCDNNWINYDEPASGANVICNDTLPSTKEKLKIFIVSGTDEAISGYGEEAHIVVAKNKEKAINFFFGSEKGFQKSDLGIKEFIIPDHEYSECICSYYE